MALLQSVWPRASGELSRARPRLVAKRRHLVTVSRVWRREGELRRLAGAHAHDPELLDGPAGIDPFGAHGVDMRLAGGQWRRLEDTISARLGHPLLVEPHLGGLRDVDADGG